MSDLEEKRRKLRLILAEAHRRKETGPPEPGPAWRQRVMAGLPGPGRAAEWPDPWSLLGGLAWKLAPAAGALALILALLVNWTGPDPASEVVRLMSADAADTGLYTFYQSESPNE